MQNIIMRVTLTQNHYGAKLPKLDTLDTKSARHARAILNNMKLNVGAAAKLPAQEQSEKTTSTYYFKVDPKVAVAYFNKIDKERSTPDFLKKAEEYNNHKKELNLDPKQFDGRGKLDYYNKLKKWTFKYYTLHAQMIIIDGDNKEFSTKSIIHNRLHTIDETGLKAQFDGLAKEIDNAIPTEIFDMDAWNKKHSKEGNKSDNNSDKSTVTTPNS